MRSRALSIAALVAVLLPACADVARVPQNRSEPMTLDEAMSPGDGDGFLRALEPIEFEFPRDHGPHAGFQTEWWYLVGNLEGGGRRFGYQVTFFRSSLQPPETAERSEAPSAWAAEDIFMAHFALTDQSEQRFHAFERFSRASLGLAGATAQPTRIWLEDWQLESADPATLFPASLEASQNDVGLRLEIAPGKPMVLQGERGLSAKGSKPGNASYYYSFTRLPTRGIVRLGETEIEVEGESWMDREWSTSALEEGQEGWDWFALQLGDGRELMVYQMRREGGLTDPISSGVIVELDGTSRFLGVEDFDITPTATWRSDETGIDYPGGWKVTSQTADVDLSVEPLLARQEHTSSVLYWEGAVTVRGTSLGKTIEGRGYVELTGYDTADKTSP